MLIFDRFRDLAHAESVAKRIREKLGLNVRVCASQEESDAIDPFPYVLTPPILLVERPVYEQRERAVIAFVKGQEGSFAGT